LLEKCEKQSLRTQRAISEFGNAAWHPLCQAWLSFSKRQSEYSKYEGEAAASLRLLKGAEQQKKQARTLYEQFYKEGKQKEVIQAAALLSKINEHLKELKTCYEAQVKLCAYSKEFRQHYDIQFVLERQRAERTKDTKALRALQYLKGTVTMPMRDGQKRVFGIVKMLRDKAIKATWAKNGAVAGYWEAASGGEPPLSDEFWQGRFTVMEFRSGLEAMYGPRVAGDKEGKEVRRALKRLGIQPAKDQVGRKWKPFRPVNKKPKRPLGRPRTKIELETTPDIDQALAELFQRSSGKPRQPSNNQFWDSAEARRTAIQKRLMKLKEQSKKRGRPSVKG
jgi:hypothetical protein